jgi:hypothetical protein
MHNKTIAKEKTPKEGEIINEKEVKNIENNIEVEQMKNKEKRNEEKRR